MNDVSVIPELEEADFKFKHVHLIRDEYLKLRQDFLRARIAHLEVGRKALGVIVLTVMAPALVVVGLHWVLTIFFWFSLIIHPVVDILEALFYRLQIDKLEQQRTIVDV